MYIFEKIYESFNSDSTNLIEIPYTLNTKPRILSSLFCPLYETKPCRK